MVFVEVMAGMDFFPPEAGARGGIAAEIASLCATTDQAKWLVRRMLRLYRKWPGVIELRIVFCASHWPLDGVQPTEISAIYPDGIPPEFPAKPATAIAGSIRRQISASPSVRETVDELATHTDLKRQTARAFRVPQRLLTQIPITRPPDMKPITAADIAQAVQELRDNKAREEIGDGTATATGV